MKKLILIFLLFLVQDIFSYQENYQSSKNDFNNQNKYEISLGVGSLFYYGLSFKQYLSQNHSYRITGFAYFKPDDFNGKTLSASLAYNYSIYKSESEDLYFLLGANVYYNIEYSGSYTDFEEYNYFKGAIGIGISETFFSYLSLSLEIYQVIDYSLSKRGVDSIRSYEGTYTYPGISFFTGIKF